jgi:hypothetical protein
MKSILTLAALFLILLVKAQPPPYNGSYNFKNGDPATNFNKYMVVYEDRTYTQIGNYKVIGSSYVYGRHHLGNLYAKGETGLNIYLSYNVYNQDVEFYSSSNASEPLVKEIGTVDSFLLRRDSLISEDLRFYYGPVIGSREQTYFLASYTGPTYQLYKCYKVQIGVVSTNYIQSDLRQFELSYDYYYKGPQMKEPKKLKQGFYALKKEFSKLNSGSLLDEGLYNANPDEEMKKLFERLNAN